MAWSRKKALKQLRKKVRSLPVVRVIKSQPLPVNLEYDKYYLILGEVANINHYILLDYATGTILPKMYHLSDFEEVPEDDL